VRQVFEIHLKAGRFRRKGRAPRPAQKNPFPKILSAYPFRIPE
jgi:hypothetical protein